MRPSSFLYAIFVCCFASALLHTCPAAAQFTPDRLAVLDYTGSAQIGGPLVIREFETNGTPGVVMNVPDTGPNAVVGAFSTVIGSQLTLSPSGDALLFCGYASMAPVGTQLPTTDANVISRVIGAVDGNGVFTRPVTTNYFSGASIVAVTTDGTNYWAGGGNSGVCYLGPGSPSVVNADVASTNALNFTNGGLLSVTSGNVYQVGSGSPLAPASQIALFGSSTLPVDVKMSPDGNTCYTAHFSSVRKWQRTGATWSLAYTLTCAPGAWLVRIAVDFSGAAPVIYGVHNLPTKLVKWVDNGVGSPEVLLYTAGNNAHYYGIAFTPGSGCAPGQPCDDGNAATGNDLWTAGCVCAGQPNDCAGVPGGTALPGTSCDDNDPTTGGDTWQVGCTCTGQANVLLAIRALLSGPLPSGSPLMNADLRLLADFPLTEPYTALGLPPTGGTVSIDASVLAVVGINAIVDWVVVELRSTADPSMVVLRTAALIQRDGDIVGLDGASPLSLPAPPASYHVAVSHRNHLGVMSAAPIALSAVAAALDFRLPTTATWGTNAQNTIGSFRALWSGEVVRNAQISYSGSNNDRDPLLVTVGSTTPNNTITGYRVQDVNMNGTTAYTGAGNDRDPILVNVGSTTPNNTRTQQLP